MAFDDDDDDRIHHHHHQLYHNIGIRVCSLDVCVERLRVCFLKGRGTIQILKLMNMH